MDEMIEYLNIIIELISVTIWPFALIFSLLYFKKYVQGLIQVIIKRFESTSQVEFPGGFKALFYHERIESVKQIAQEAISTIGKGFSDDQKNSIKKKIEHALLNEEIPLIVLSHISSYGLLALDRVHNISNEFGIKTNEIDIAIDRLIESGYITKKEGTLYVTSNGVKRLRYEEEKPKLTIRST